MSTNEYSIRTIERQRWEEARQEAQQRAAEIQRRMLEESAQRETKRQELKQRIAGQADSERSQIRDINNHMGNIAASLNVAQNTSASVMRQMQNSSDQLSDISAGLRRSRESATELGDELSEAAADMRNVHIGVNRAHEKVEEGISASKEFAANIDAGSSILGEGLQDKSSIGGGEEIKRLQHERNLLQMPLAPIALLYIQAAEKIGYSLNDTLIGNDIEMTFTGSGDLNKAPIIVKLPSSLDETNALEWHSQIFVDANGDAICHDIIEQVQKNLNDAGIKGRTWSTGKPDKGSNRQRFQTRDNRKIREE